MSRFSLTGCCVLLFCLVAGAAYAARPASVDPIELQLSRDQIEVGVFYHGADVQVTADIPACDGAVLVLETGAEELTFNRKGKEAGIWLNVAQVVISGVPKVYLLASSKSLNEICSEDTQRQLGLGIASLRDRMKITSAKPLIGSEVEEFLKLKRETETYKTDLPATLTPTGTGSDRFSAHLIVPATVPPGTYRVMLYCFRDGQLSDKGMSELTIKRVGLTDLLASLAHERAATYGVLAIVIAMVVGIAMGIIFHSLPGSGH